MSSSSPTLGSSGAPHSPSPDPTKVLADANDVLAELWRANADFKLGGECVLLRA